MPMTSENGSPEIPATYTLAGRARTATDGTDAQVGCVWVDRVDGGVHIEQISLRPDWA